MKLKKLKRLLSLTLSAAMMVSMVSMPVHAETAPDNTQPALEENLEGQGKAEGEEGVPEAEGQEQAGKPQETADSQTPSGEDTEGVGGRLSDEAADGEAARVEKAGARVTTDTGAGEDARADSGNTGDAGTGDTGAGDNTGEEQSEAIVVGDKIGQTRTLDDAVEAAAAGTVKTIQLEKDVTLTKNLDGVTIKTQGHRITIPAEASVEFSATTVIENELEAQAPYNTMANNRTVLVAEGTLTIKGGSYKTKGVQLMKVTGNTTVEGGTFECTATGTDANGYYDTKTLIDVDGASAKLTMTAGTVKAEVGDKGSNGMYGIYVWNGGEVELGTESAGPTVSSAFAAVAMNNTTAPGKITIKNGTYKSSVACTAEAHNKFNAVIYLPASATVDISGGTFEATGTLASGTNNKLHVISIPYNKIGDSSVRLNLNITGGTFNAKAGGEVFCFPGKADENKKINVKVSGGSFSSDISKELPETGVFPEGFTAYQPEDGGMFGVAAPATVSLGTKKYPTLEKAIEAATGIDKTITLLGNMELEGSYTLTDLTLDTKGYMITVPEGKTLELTGGTVKNELAAEKAASGDNWSDNSKNKTMFDVRGTLKIHGGTYQTKGVYMIQVVGNVEIGESAALICNATESDISSQANYDGASLISVTGNGNLTVKKAAISANVGNSAKTDGMYGIYVNRGGTLTLGDGTANPTIDSMFAPVAMNGLYAPGKITIEGGEYSCNAECEDAGIKKFNAVLYLPANADVTVNGGTFTAKGTKGEQHVISVPYSTVNGKQVAINLFINNGTFKIASGGEGSKIFYSNKEDGDKLNLNIRGGSFSMKPDYISECTPSHQDEATGNWVVEGEPNHEIKWVSQKDATCWEEGVIGHYECAKCHRIYESNGENPAELPTDSVVIPKKEHTGTKTEAHTAATCTEESNIEYYYCENCENYYKTEEALKTDTDGSKAVSRDEIFTAPKGHNYTKTDDEGNEVLDPIVDASKFDPAQFQYGKANNVTVKLVCKNEGCGGEGGTPNEITADEVSVTIAEGELTGDCSKERTIKLNVDAVFHTDKLGNAIEDPSDYLRTSSKGVEYKTKVGQHAFDADSVTVDWDAFDISNFKTGEANGVTAKGTCKNCGTVVENPTVTVTSTNYPAAGTTPSCQVKYRFTAKVTFGEGAAATFVNKDAQIAGKHNLTPHTAYKAESCMEAGQWASYQCTNEGCGKLFLGEDSAKRDESVEEANLIIKKRPHTFHTPEFSWMTEEGKTDKAQAAFKCDVCKNTVTVTEIEPAENGNHNVPCGTTATLKWDVSVDFDRAAVVEHVDGANQSLEYVPDHTGDKDIVKYTGELTKTEVKRHDLVGLTGDKLKLAWADTSGSAENGYDVTKGVKAIITCKNCDKNVTVMSPSKIIDGDNCVLDDPGMESVIPTVAFTLNNTKTTPATCKAGGEAVYDVTVSYKEGTEVKTIGTGELTTKTSVDPNAHDWSPVTWNWTYEKNANNNPVMVSVDVRDASAPGKTVQTLVPKYTVTAEYKCTRDCGTDGATVTRNATVTLGETDATTPSTEPHIVIDAVYQKGDSCADLSSVEFTATVYDGDKQIPGESEESFIKPGTGHQITVAWEWESDADEAQGTPVTRYTKVSATRKCSVCSGNSSVPEEYQYPSKTWSVTIPETDGTTVDDGEDGDNTVLVVTHNGNPATCSQGGKLTYAATLNEGTEAKPGPKIAEDKKELISDKLEHEFRWFVNPWQENANASAADGSDAYTVTRTKKCQNGCGTLADGESAAVENVSITGVTYTPEEGNCITAPSQTWVINETLPQGEAYFESQTDEAGKLLDSTGEGEDEVAVGKMTVTGVLDEDAHDYGAATVVWDMEAIEAGAETATVTISRVCANKADHTQEITLTAQKQEMEEEWDCTQDYELEYKVPQAALEEALNGETWEFPQDWADGTKTLQVTGAEAHDLEFVRGQTSSDCTVPVWPDYYVCKTCGKMFSDLDATEPYTGPDKDHAVAPGHNYIYKFYWVPGKVNEEAKAEFTCTRCGKTEVAEVTLTGRELAGVDPECSQTKNDNVVVDGDTLEKGWGYKYVQASALVPGSETETKTSMLYTPLGPVGHKFDENGVCEWCDTKEGGVTINFYGRDNVTSIGSIYLQEDNMPGTAADVELAAPVKQLGYEFTGWAMSDEEDREVLDDAAAKEAIFAAIKALAADEKTVSVYAVYEKAAESKGTIQVTYFLKDAAEAFETADPAEQEIGARFTATAEEEKTVNGKTVYFSHWERDGQVVGTGLSYGLHVQTAATITLKAVYVENKEDAQAKQPTAVITDIYTSIVNGAKKLSFSATMTVPEEGYTIEEVGMLYSVKEVTQADLVVENANKNGVKKTTFNSTTNSSTNILTMQIPDTNVDRKIYAVPYVTVTKADGTQDTIYGALKSSTYNEALASQGK